MWECVQAFVKALKGLASDGSNSEMDIGCCPWPGPSGVGEGQSQSVRLDSGES